MPYPDKFFHITNNFYITRRNNKIILISFYTLYFAKIKSQQEADFKQNRPVKFIFLTVPCYLLKFSHQYLLCWLIPVKT